MDSCVVNVGVGNAYSHCSARSKYLEQEPLNRELRITCRQCGLGQGWMLDQG